MRISSFWSVSRRCLLIATLTAAALPAQQPPAPVRSPEVHADGKVSFRLRAPHAEAVILAREGSPRVPMTKGDDGVWTHTTPEPLAPDYWGYSFIVDGVGLIDPGNPLMKPNLLNTTSMVHVPGPKSGPDMLTWDRRTGSAAVPHGAVHRHFYDSGVVGDARDFFVYTPPGYDKGSTRYPVLYLLHGFSDDASGWTAVGRAHTILDNLLADGKLAKPMLVVMPLGYGAPEILYTRGDRRAPSLREKNMSGFRDALLKEVIPMVEKLYRVDTKRESRAIAGLSMGGAESLYTGLNALDTFAWVGAFSAGGLGEDYAATFPKLSAADDKRLKLLWMACGVDDRLIEGNRKFSEWLKTKQIRHEWIETPGAHTWLVWRRYLSTLAPLLFR